MGLKELEDARKKMAEVQGKAKPSPVPPADGGSMSGGAMSPGDKRPADAEPSEGDGTRSGIKSIPEKQSIAEGMVARSKAEDVENSREQTTDKGYRHDMITPPPINIPPTIQSERMRMGQHPLTGEPWTRSERIAYEREQEDARRQHAEAVRLSEDQMRKEAVPPPIQPIPHVPTSVLTAAQKKAMQDSQDRGEGPVAQARARDQFHPDELGRQDALRRLDMERRTGTGEDVRQGSVIERNDDIDKDLERAEVDPDVIDDDTDDLEEGDADQVEADLNQKNEKK